MNALGGLAWLLVFQGAGDISVKALALPFPGPVVGLLLLLPVLRWRSVRVPVQAVAALLLEHLSLLFVPVGVGVVTHLALVARHGIGLAAVIVVSTWIGMVATAVTMQVLLRSSPAGRADGDGDGGGDGGAR